MHINRRESNGALWKMKNEILKAINKAIKQLCRTAQNVNRRHHYSTTRKTDKFLNIYFFVRFFSPNLFCD